MAEPSASPEALGQYLLDVARVDDADEVNRLVALGAPIGFREPRTGWTALHMAAEHGSLDAARTLLELGAAIDVYNKHGWTPLAVAVDSAIDSVIQDGGIIDRSMIQLLINAGADPTAFGSGGQSALAVAVAYKATEVIDLLRTRHRV